MEIVLPRGWDDQRSACGAPVLVHPRGAAPEIVEHGVTGYVEPDHAGLVARVADIDRLDRAACRAAVEDHFSTSRMAGEHLQLYEEILDERQFGIRAVNGMSRPVGSR